MAYTPKPNGRVARELNNDLRADINRALDIMMQMAGETDPVRCQRILREAEPYLRGALNGSWQMEQLFEAAARRGPYTGGAE